MSEQDNNGKQDASGKEPGKAIGRRDILQGLSTVPVPGFLGYAVKKQADYENARLAKTATMASARKSNNG
jgi:hypothetical protein